MGQGLVLIQVCLFGHVCGEVAWCCVDEVEIERLLGNWVQVGFKPGTKGVPYIS